jgi:enoyl-[acyl-carrier protein] reductase II
MKTRITEIFNIKYPIVLSGMSWISTPELVAAVANAGGLGILATGVMNPEQTKEALDKTRELTDKPFGANVPLYVPGARENAEFLLEHKVPIINYSLGKGDWIAKAVKEYGGKTLATVTNRKHALSAQKDGADALIVTGHEAAAHGGEVTSLVLIPSLADELDIPVVAAGGFSDGRGLAAALVLGADGIAMGTRFMGTKESPVHQNMKELSVKKNAEDTLYSDKFDGLPCRVMKEKGSERMLKKRLQIFNSLINSKEIARDFELPWAKLAMGILFSGYKRSKFMARMANGYKLFRMGTLDGDSEKGILPIGQTTGIIHDIPTVDELMERIVKDAYARNQAILSTFDDQVM